MYYYYNLSYKQYFDFLDLLDYSLIDHTNETTDEMYCILVNGELRIKDLTYCNKTILYKQSSL